MHLCFWNLNTIITKITVVTNKWFQHVMAFACISIILKEHPKTNFAKEMLAKKQKSFLRSLFRAILGCFVVDLGHALAAWILNLHETINKKTTTQHHDKLCDCNVSHKHKQFC